MAFLTSARRLGGKFTLPALPYKLEGLEPHISARTLQFHYGKHHQGYVNKLNELTKDSKNPNHDNLESIIKNEKGTVYNQAAQVWNHNFYFKCLAPPSDETAGPEGSTLKKINKDFGSLDSFKKAFKDRVLAHFGAGWVWLVYNTGNNKMEILDGHDAQCPIGFAPRCSPLLTCDVWEHAYYLDAQNDRAKYFENFWNVINWNFVNDQLMNNLLETY